MGLQQFTERALAIFAQARRHGVEIPRQLRQFVVTADVRARVVSARARQVTRQGVVNARLEGAALKRVCARADSQVDSLLEEGVSKFSLSVRGVTRVLRVARTVADLEGSTSLAARHLAEALHFRLPDPVL